MLVLELAGGNSCFTYLSKDALPTNQMLISSDLMMLSTKVKTMLKWQDFLASSATQLIVSAVELMEEMESLPCHVVMSEEDL